MIKKAAPARLVYLAHRLMERHAEMRRDGRLKFVRPDNGAGVAKK